VHQTGGISAPVKVLLIEEEKQFSIEVGDEAPHAVSGERGPGDSDGEADEDEMGLAVISGLVDDVEVSAGEHGGLIKMTWPTTPPPTILV
jgi:anti-sigma regulatory factor (Ser/Thr protein kinase)